MSRPPSCQSTPQFYRISDKDLTEIELHSVDSINDLHRTHEHSRKGTNSVELVHMTGENNFGNHNVPKLVIFYLHILSCTMFVLQE